jgi:hypothetical protein
VNITNKSLNNYSAPFKIIIFSLLSALVSISYLFEFNYFAEKAFIHVLLLSALALLFWCNGQWRPFARNTFLLLFVCIHFAVGVSAQILLPRGGLARFFAYGSSWQVHKVIPFKISKNDRHQLILADQNDEFISLVRFYHQEPPPNLDTYFTVKDSIKRRLSYKQYSCEDIKFIGPYQKKCLNTIDEFNIIYLNFHSGERELSFIDKMDNILSKFAVISDFTENSLKGFKVVSFVGKKYQPKETDEH